MKKTIFFTIILICLVQLINAQQTEKVQGSSAMEMLTKQPWIKTDTQYGAIQMAFTKNLTYTVTFESNNMSIKGTFSLKKDLLTFETDDAGCGIKGEYTIKVAKATLTFVLNKEDPCNERKTSTLGVWKAVTNNP
jgi:hypothetical protein